MVSRDRFHKGATALRAIDLDFVREVKNTRSRFFSIFVLVALAVAFLSGLRATAPDMNFIYIILHRILVGIIRAGLYRNGWIGEHRFGRIAAVALYGYGKHQIRLVFSAVQRTHDLIRQDVVLGPVPRGTSHPGHIFQ